VLQPYRVSRLSQGPGGIFKAAWEDLNGSGSVVAYGSFTTKDATKEFIDRYTNKHGYVPDDVAALTWDAMRIVQAAIEGAGELTGDIKTNHKAVRDALASIKDFAGITGSMTFAEDGDPVKCAVIVRISDAGEFEFYKSVCP